VDWPVATVREDPWCGPGSWSGSPPASWPLSKFCCRSISLSAAGHVAGASIGLLSSRRCSAERSATGTIWCAESRMCAAQLRPSSVSPSFRTASQHSSPSSWLVTGTPSVACLPLTWIPLISVRINCTTTLSPAWYFTGPVHGTSARDLCRCRVGQSAGKCPHHRKDIFEGLTCTMVSLKAPKSLSRIANLPVSLMPLSTRATRPLWCFAISSECTKTTLPAAIGPGVLHCRPGVSPFSVDASLHGSSHHLEVPR